VSAEPDWIGVREYEAVVPGDGRRPVRLLIGRPVPDSRGDYQCAAYIEGLDEKLRLAFGVDSFQALILGAAMLRIHLEAWQRSGVTFHWPGSEDADSADAIFSKFLRIPTDD
jgi:hypothetical protein